MAVDLSLFELVTGASFLVQLVMLILLVISVIAWTLIFRKRSELKGAKEAADEFEDRFWSGKELNSLYAELAAREIPLHGMEGIFFSGFREFVRLRKQTNAEHRAVLDGTQRAMRVSLAREIDTLEAALPFLATAGSTSPYIGLFGTVWGIMNSFRALGNAHQATLAMVAPGIAEALIATAMGLFAAIPAVIAYNRYIHEVERLINRYDTFLEEFSTILQRQLHLA
ncbi:protein TolQ [Nitrosococcus halophilus Nc 4]|uniref:Tol-Pal system protein TolQ n=1 Tax=Nitrosococcus halophilus (strain Nc4) TaxID=472759 RepID=D5C4W7_NITHN|nr:protein TolQ [Nitrosococcus halophilus]ADE13390.1 protein TolQ [Nitrosococcus halophilus Nc 4]